MTSLCAAKYHRKGKKAFIFIHLLVIVSNLGSVRQTRREQDLNRQPLEVPNSLQSHSQPHESQNHLKLSFFSKLRFFHSRYLLQYISRAVRWVALPHSRKVVGLIPEVSASRNVCIYVYILYV